jgi:hypothetical protein
MPYRDKEKERIKAKEYRLTDKYKETRRKWLENNREKIRERKKKAYKKWRNGGGFRRLLYGVSQSEYEKRLEEQNYSCAICGKRQSELKQSLGVDHNHQTGKVRGLLCAGCNIRLGHVENIKFLYKAEEYLNKYEETLF